MRILLFGCEGQLGWELQRSLAPLGELVAVGRAGAPDVAGDFTDPAAIAATVAATRPRVVVNAAAYTDVDRAESEPGPAHLVNAATPGALARAAAQAGAIVLHFSTDYVFDGSGSRPWREDDAPAPLNTYGRTKLAGEREVAAATPRHLVLRAGWLYGRGRNFARSILAQARTQARLQVVDDQFGAPTGADLLADVSAHVLRAVLRDEGAWGTYHVAPAGFASRHGYAQWLLREARQLGLALATAPEAVEAVGSDAVGVATAAARPRNTRLATDRLAATFGLAMPAWEQGALRYLREALAP